MNWGAPNIVTVVAPDDRWLELTVHVHPHEENRNYIKFMDSRNGVGIDSVFEKRELRTDSLMDVLNSVGLVLAQASFMTRRPDPSNGAF
jgi:hypothetical protein